MSTYLVDFENVGVGGIDGIEKLSAQDRVVIFYGKQAAAVPFERHIEIASSRAEVRYIKVDKTGKNYLDFQLSSYCGYLIGSTAEKDFIIVSRDNGFGSMEAFWHGKEMSGKLISMKRQPAIAAEEQKQESVREIIVDRGEKQEKRQDRAAKESLCGHCPEEEKTEKKAEKKIEKKTDRKAAALRHKKESRQEEQVRTGRKKKTGQETAEEKGLKNEGEKTGKKAEPPAVLKKETLSESSRKKKKTRRNHDQRIHEKAVRPDRENEPETQDNEGKKDRKTAEQKALLKPAEGGQIQADPALSAEEAAEGTGREHFKNSGAERKTSEGMQRCRRSRRKPKGRYVWRR